MSKFKLSITLGNEAMSEIDDIAVALRNLAAKLTSGDFTITDGRSSGNIKDANGNTVGEWKVTR